MRAGLMLRRHSPFERALILLGRLSFWDGRGLRFSRNERGLVMHKRLSIPLLGFIVLLLQALYAPLAAEDGKLDKKELDQLLAPIALYPDDLITNILMASTYPLDVVQAARWIKEPANAKLKGDALAKAVES